VKTAAVEHYSYGVATPTLALLSSNAYHTAANALLLLLYWCYHCAHYLQGFLGSTAQLLEVLSWCLCAFSCVSAGGKLEAQQVLQVCTHSCTALYSIKHTTSHACSGVHCTSALTRAVARSSYSQQNVCLCELYSHVRQTASTMIKLNRLC
jgi:hypothetical protein